MLPSTMIGFHNLEYFNVGKNSFYGPSLKSLFSLPLLKEAILNGNQLTGPIEFTNISSSSKLYYLDLDSNRFNGPIPKSISKFLNLRYLHLSHNSYSGTIPISISKSVNLSYFDLSNKMLEGQVTSSIWRWETVRLSHNFFSSFDNSSDTTLIKDLDLSWNSFQELFRLWTCNIKRLSFLHFSNNLFSDSIPPCLRNLTDSLSELNLHNNNFSGILPDIFTSATELQFLDVSHNKLEGKLPKSLINCKALQFVNVEGNKIKDTFTSWLGSLPILHVLILRSNEFFGPLFLLHVSIGFQSLRIIDISHNGFTGTLPPYCFSNWRVMTTLIEEFRGYMTCYMSSNYSFYQSMEIVNKGVDMNFERIQENWRAIDFSGNKIYGEILESVGLLKDLRLLNLSGNAFTSEILQSLANLSKLETLDLSCNQLTGQIPQAFGKLFFLSYMNFSHNLLQGFVPRGTQFQRQNCSSFLDNPGLYGLEEICGETHFPNRTLQEPGEFLEAEEHIFNWIAAAIAYGPGVFCGLVIGHIFMPHNHEWFIAKFGQR